MTRTRYLLLLTLLVGLPFGGCSKGGECDSCSSDADCKSDLYCVNFNDQNGNFVGKRCGSGIGATNCRVRRSPPATITSLRR